VLDCQIFEFKRLICKILWNKELGERLSAVGDSRLQAEGMLKIDGRTVTISNLKALEAEMDSPE
jgi:hypothetical protein